MQWWRDSMSPTDSSKTSRCSAQALSSATERLSRRSGGKLISYHYRVNQVQPLPLKQGLGRPSPSRGSCCAPILVQYKSQVSFLDLAFFFMFLAAASLTHLSVPERLTPFMSFSAWISSLDCLLLFPSYLCQWASFSATNMLIYSFYSVFVLFVYSKFFCCRVLFNSKKCGRRPACLRHIIRSRIWKYIHPEPQLYKGPSPHVTVMEGAHPTWWQQQRAWVRAPGRTGTCVMQEEKGKSRRWVLAYVSEEEVVWLSAECGKKMIPRVWACFKISIVKLRDPVLREINWLLFAYLIAFFFFFFLPSFCHQGLSDSSCKEECEASKSIF